MQNLSKKFDVSVLLTVTTERLLSPIESLYEILWWMTKDSPHTHQLGRFSKECKPWLLRWFPELVPVSLHLDSLDRWISADVTGTAEEGIKMWLAEMKMVFPVLRDTYDVPCIPQDDHDRKDPYDELVAMRETDKGIIVISKGTE